VTYTPSARGTGTHTVTAAYSANDDVHAISADNTGSPITVNLRSTSTSVSCADASIAINQGTLCTATVSDTNGGGATAPAGTVTFSNASGSFSPSATCTLAPASPTTSKCQATYTPSAAGNQTIGAAYSPSGASTDVHAASSGSTSVSVHERSTSTSVSCIPASVTIGQPSTCTATVTDTDSGTKSAPSGTVAFTRSGSGSGHLTPTSCTLGAPTTISSSCSVTYTPDTGANAHTVTATYVEASSAVHASSNGSTTVAATLRTTSTSVSCTPMVNPINTSSTCTATVTDTNGAGASDPGGTVNFTSDNLSGIFTPASCTLNSDGNASTFTSSCSVSYKSTIANVDNVTATYVPNDNIHAGSSGTTIVVFYDNNGGFVTGGGWILEPASAGPPPIVIGDKSNFGFNAKYQKGASLPTGEMEFQYKAGNINFHGSSYDWLVVSQSGSTMKAEAQGSGTVNGGGNYAFFVSVTDNGGTDKFRIRMWDKVTNYVVYDTQYVDPTTAEPMTITGGGNIVIHK
jgi:hypothetical protein